MGHVRDLPANELGVDIEHDFRPTYQLVKGKGEVVSEIREAAAGAERVYLATDPDREGEAIAWHVAAAAGLHESKTQRITFHQVTKSAVQEALAHPRTWIAPDRRPAGAPRARPPGGLPDQPAAEQVAAQGALGRARAIRGAAPGRGPRARDPGLCARGILDAGGRAASGASAASELFRARLHKMGGQDPDLQDRGRPATDPGRAGKGRIPVTRVQKGQRQRNPQPPFITSTLQAEAGRKLHSSPRQTMRLAQQLYEGIDLDGERVGLITYMRTDSTHVAPEAQDEARAVHRRALGREVSARQAARLPRQGGAGPGGARGHSPHLRACAPRRPCASTWTTSRRACTS